MTMICPREHLQYLCCAMATLAVILVVVRRWVRSAEPRVLLLEIPIFLVTLIACIEAYEYFRAPADLCAALILVELGVFARVYDSRRAYRSVSGTLRNVGNLYMLAGLVCALSRFADFPVLLWVIPLGLFSCGYFFLRRRRGAANLCKGFGVLITVGFVASMIYDVHEGLPPSRGLKSLRGRLLPEIVRPSFVEQLNARNEKVEALEGAQKRLADELRRSRAEQRELEGKVEKETSSRRELERKAAALEKAASAADETVRRLKAENEEMKAALKKETESRTSDEQKLVELEKIRTAAKESVSATTEKLTDAAENLKKAVAERDGLKAELDALKSAAPAATGSPAPSTEVQALAQQVREKEEQRTALAAEVARLQQTLERVREALAVAPAASEKGE
jgi:hypothetical protein